MFYYIKSISSFIFVLLGAFTLSFILIHLIPGDPIEIILGDYATNIDRVALEKELGLDKPMIEQYFTSLKNAINLNFGRSLFSKKPVAIEIANYFPRSALLGLSSLLVALAVGIPLGVISSLKQNQKTDIIISLLSLILFSLPSFCIAPILIWLFSIELDWLPVGDYGTLQHLVLPTVSLSIGLIAILIRMTRTSMLEVLNENYILVTKAKGLSEFKIYFVHAFKNAIFPILTISGLIFSSLITGTIIIEVIFDWPGLGLLLFKSIQNRDYPMVQTCVLLISFIYILINFITDILYLYLNPKLAEFSK